MSVSKVNSAAPTSRAARARAPPTSAHGRGRRERLPEVAAVADVELDHEHAALQEAACAQLTRSLGADSAECHRMWSTLAVRSVSAATSRSVPRRATLQSYNLQAEPQERLRGCVDCANLPIRNNRRSTPPESSRQERQPHRRRCLDAGARDARCRRQPQGAAFDAATSCLSPVQGSVESKSASPPTAAASSARASVRMVSRARASFLVRRGSGFLIGVR